MNILEKYLISNFFLLSLLDCILIFYGYERFAKFSMILLVYSIVFSLNKIPKWTLFDFALILFMAIIITNGVLSDIHPKLFKDGIRYQLLLMFFFYIGKYSVYTNGIFTNGRLLMPLYAVICIYLYLFTPSWYLVPKLAQVTMNLNDYNVYLEMMRLSGFAVYPYWISYGSFIILYYCIAKIASDVTNITYYDYFTIIVCFITIIFTEQRAPIFAAVTSLSFIFIYNLFRTEKGQKTRSISFYFMAILASCGFLFLLIDNVNIGQITHLQEKISSVMEGAELIQQRKEQFSLNVDFSIFGEGIGKYSHGALSLNKPSIPDQQYLRILYETGVIGTVGYFLIIFVVLMKGIRKTKKNLFELGVISFYLLTMFGANSLSMEGYHSAIFWICCGRIFRKENIAVR